MSTPKEHCKPRGQSASFIFDENGVTLKYKILPTTKEKIELQFAKAFCSEAGAFRHHFDRYGKFIDLESQPENSLDFIVTTALGKKWIELAEFAPLKEFAGKYENASGEWSASDMARLLIELVNKKNIKRYGKNVILVIYQTHDRFFIPPPIIRTLPDKLAPLELYFEAIYIVSPSGMVMEAWPGPSGEQGPKCENGVVRVGTFTTPTNT